MRSPECGRICLPWENSPFEQAVLVSVPFPLLDGFALVVLFFALGQGDFGFGFAALPVQAEWHDGVSVPFPRTDQLADFLLVQQQLAASGRVRVDMG